MSEKETKKINSEIILSWITVISVILGGFWAILEYSERQKSRISDKAAQVLVFVERYNRDPIQKYKNNKVNALAEAYRDLYEKESKRVPDDCISFQRKVVKKFNLRFEIDNVSFFYDELFVCVDTGLCDEKIAQSFFGKHAYDFMWGLQCYIPFVKKERERRKVAGYAEGLSYFVKSYENGILIKGNH